MLKIATSTHPPQSRSTSDDFHEQSISVLLFLKSFRTALRFWLLLFFYFLFTYGAIFMPFHRVYHALFVYASHRFVLNVFCSCR